MTKTATPTQSIETTRRVLAQRRQQAADLEARVLEQTRRLTGDPKADDKLNDELFGLEARLATTKASIAMLDGVLAEALEAERQVRWAEEREAGKTRLAALRDRVVASRLADYEALQTAGEAFVDAVEQFVAGGKGLAHEAVQTALLVRPGASEHHEPLVRAAAGKSAATASAVAGILARAIEAYGVAALDQFISINPFAPKGGMLADAAKHDLAQLEARLQ